MVIVQFLLTGLAGLALGIVAMRLWQTREPAPASAEPATACTRPDGIGEKEADGSGVRTRQLLMAAGGLAAVAAVVIAVRAPEGSEAAAAPALAVTPGASGKELDDVDTMIAKLEERLKREPTDGEGFRMLGWSYMMTNRPEKAIAPYKRALELLPNSALVHSGYGEALAGTAKGTVTPEARGEFERSLAIDPTEPRAKYFLALWQAQNGQPKQALEKWIALANNGPADAPWQTDLRAKITEVSGKLGLDVTARLKTMASAGNVKVLGAAPQLDPGTVKAASALPEAQRSAMVDGMVSGLAEKLKANPADADRWVLLLRSRMVLKQADMARSDLVTARRALAKDANGLGKVNAAAKDLGVPGA